MNKEEFKKIKKTILKFGSKKTGRPAGKKQTKATPKEIKLLGYKNLTKKLWATTEPKLIAKGLSRGEIQSMRLLIENVPVWVAEGLLPEEIDTIIDITSL